MTNREAGQYRTWLRRQAGLPTVDRTPIRVVDTASAPKLTGEGAYWTTLSGKTRVHHPNAYGWRTWYHRSTHAVEVGVKWLAKRAIPLEAVK